MSKILDSLLLKDTKTGEATEYQIQDSQLKARVDNLIANAGNTDDNAELIDIRVGEDGTQYPTAGEAVRGQVSKLKGDLVQETGKLSGEIGDISEIVGVTNLAVKSITSRGAEHTYFNFPCEILVGEEYSFFLKGNIDNLKSYHINYLSSEGTLSSPEIYDGEIYSFKNINRDRRSVQIDLMQKEIIEGENFTLYFFKSSDGILTDVKGLEVMVNDTIMPKIGEIENATSKYGDIQVRASDSIIIDIPNTGEIVQNATIRLALHRGEKRGDNVWNEIFSNGFTQDFEGIRFFDEEGNHLKYVVESHGNYDFIKDSKIQCRPGLLHFADGRLVSFDSSRAWITTSSDNGETWTDFIQGYRPRWVDKRDRLYYQKSNSIYRVNSDGTENVLVLAKETIESAIGITLTEQVNSPVMRWNEAQENDLSYSVYYGIYLNGNYSSATKEWTPHAQIWKCNENDGSFHLAYDQKEAEHVHRISVDRATIPNVIYAGLDNTGSSHRPWIVRSVDGGNTWEDVSSGNPFQNRDYGWTYIHNGIGFGGGETNILGGETLYKTTDVLDGSKCIPVLKTHQGIRGAMSPDNGRTILVTGTSCNTNGIAQIYMSEDYGDTWKTAFADEHRVLTASTAGYGNRAFTDYFIPKGSKEKQVIATADDDVEGYALRCFFGENHYYALVYVNVGDIPHGGKRIVLNPNYLLGKSDMDSSSDDIVKPYWHMRLNEGEGTFTRVQSMTKNINNVLELWDKADVCYGGLYPAKVRNAYGAKLKSTGSANVGVIAMSRYKNFSFSFCIKMPKNVNDFTSSTKRYIMTSANGNAIYIQNGNLYMKLGTVSTQVKLDPIMKQSLGMYCYVMVTVSNSDTPIVTVYTYDNKTTVTNASSWGKTNINNGDWFLGKSSLGSDESNYTEGICDIRFYTKCLTDAEVRMCYHGRNYMPYDSL